MRTLLRKVLGNPNDKILKTLRETVTEINALEPEYQRLTDDQLKESMTRLRDEVASGAALDDILPESFAATREAARRTLGQRHYDVQLMGGIVLHQGKIAEMKTGEGKTQTATLAIALNALEGHGVHLVTVNDYLVRRDTQWMGRVYHALGLTVGCIQHDEAFQYDPDYVNEDERLASLRPVSRSEAYLCDITYGTNNEFGFDYLRDNMAPDLRYCVQRGLHYGIVDEVDNILIDEARTPLIISGQGEEAVDRYYQFAQLVRQLRESTHYEIDLKRKTVSINETGIDKVEQLLGIPDGESIYDDRYQEFTHYLEQALKAQALFHRDTAYIVLDGEVIIVDEFTGRQMIGRRFSEGLHQAIEAKEGVRVQRETVTEATITFQNYFRLYTKLAGMTGTAETEEEELHMIYGLDVVPIPTNMDMIRTDYPDQIYKSELAKFRAVVNEIKDMRTQNRPVLVGTTSIERSELLSEMLQRSGVQHSVLNAKFHEREAEIIKDAGQPGHVTIATNMAGRGTDIVLGSGVADRGGLHIIGTERHESRRIDNQLRGRAGRQGDPGSSRFYLSLEDELMKRFGTSRVSGLMGRLGMDEDMPIEHGIISKSIESAQTKVEGHNFDLRKHVVEYDDVMNKQREVIYSNRRRILEGENLRDKMLEMIERQIQTLVAAHSTSVDSNEVELGEINRSYRSMVPMTDLDPGSLESLPSEQIEELLYDDALKHYEAREREIGADLMRFVERTVMLSVIDQLWREHLTQMDDMRQGIGLQAYGQRDPLVAYKREGFSMFEALLTNIEYDTTHKIYFANVSRAPVQAAPRNLVTNHPEETGSATPQRRKNKKIGRNEPCWCGSGKKFKLCHGAPEMARVR
ncbi:MAG TPA: preprotein translocase subunit SecA [Thermomicrobiales bacterium]|nr:preprotein translocase subunit SecA [Thermomicrobiales bacterium]